MKNILTILLIMIHCLGITQNDSNQDYHRIVKKGDSLIEIKSYLRALEVYKEAYQLTASDTLDERIQQTLTFLKEEEGCGSVDKSYDKIVTKADDLFNQKEFTKSKNIYERALMIRPKDIYVRNRIKAIDQIDSIIEIDFDYELIKVDSSIINVKARLINLSSDTIYFLSETCNGLDYYLSTKSDSIEISHTFHCNATFPKKNILLPNSQYEFSTKLQSDNYYSMVELKLKLVRLRKNTSIKDRFIDEIIKSNSDSVVLLEGPLKPIN